MSKNKDKSSAQLKAESEIRGLRQELRYTLNRHDLDGDDRANRAALINREIVFRGGEPEPGVGLTAASSPAAKRSTATKRSTAKRSVKKKRG